MPHRRGGKVGGPLDYFELPGVSGGPGILGKCANTAEQLIRELGRAVISEYILDRLQVRHFFDAQTSMTVDVLT